MGLALLFRIFFSRFDLSVRLRIACGPNSVASVVSFLYKWSYGADFSSSRITPMEKEQNEPVEHDPHCISARRCAPPFAISWTCNMGNVGPWRKLMSSLGECECDLTRQDTRAVTRLGN